ncbi:MAG: protein kinase [Halothiobacillus sp.]|nr:protein kinase [Halothiobacillus sp.]
MKNPFLKKDNCEHVLAYSTRYTVPVAAALWCGIQPDRVQEILDESNKVHSAIYKHQNYPCLEHRCKAIHEAIDAGALPVSRETGKSFDGSTSHVAPERRHVSRQDLKEWIAREFPADKPAFLFDEIERKTHAAINTASYLTLQAECNALKAELSIAEKWGNEAKREMDALRVERDSLLAMVNKANAPGERAETTYLNIIGGLLGLMLGKTPAGKPQSVYENQAAIIEALLAHNDRKLGISKRTLEEKFAAANRSLNAT